MITSLSADRNVTPDEQVGGISADSPASQQFMTLLITQLQYQDPLSPMEAKEFTAQLAQFSELEQIVQMNDSLSALKVYEQSASNARSLNLIGRSARAGGSLVNLPDEGGADVHFSLAGDTRETRVNIYNSLGVPVRSLSIGAMNAGEHAWHWDGLDGQGKAASPGLYTVEVAGEDSSGNTVSAETFIEGRVDSVQFSDQGTSLMLAGVPVSMADILKVWQ